MMRVLISCLVLILAVACGRQADNKYLKYQNITILSDLSSRLNNRTPKDTVEIFKIVDYFKRECVKPGEKIGDKSCIAFSSFSQQVAASIDISGIKNLGEKQSFINSTGKYKDNGLDQKLKDFKKTVTHVYSTIRNPGLDLISMLIEKIDKEPIVKKDFVLTDGLDTTFISYENHIYIFTDGYLEYRNISSNNEFYFGDEQIRRVRNYCATNQVNINEALVRNRSMCLPSYQNEKNKYVNLHILESHERDFDILTQTYKNPTGQRDNEILEAVWRKWAIESGFKSFEWKKY